VIFIASLSSFDEMMVEDDSANSLEDSLELFEQICKSSYFLHEHMTLILSKPDLLIRKIKRGKKLKDYHATSDYQGVDDDYRACIEHIALKFRNAFDRAMKSVNEQKK